MGVGAPLTDLRVRDATADDLPAVARIYDHYVATSTAIFQSEPVGAQMFADKLAGLVPPDRILVAEEAGRILGYAASGPYRPRPLYDVRELSVYLAPDAAGRGIGTALYAALIDHLDGAAVHSLVGVVALPNDASEALHAAFGFRKVGVMWELGHKFGQRIDCSYWQRMNPLAGAAHRTQ